MTTRIQRSAGDLEDRARAAVADCVHCGFCLPACPTYVLWQREPDSPRGRIQLLDGWLRGRFELDPQVAERFDNCLGCLACVSACPSGVHYEHVIDLARMLLANKVGPGPSARRDHERTVDLALGLFPYRARLRVAAIGLLAYRRSGLGTRVSRSGIWRRLPRALREMDALAPAVSLRSLANRIPNRPARPVRGRVVLLRGCVQSVFFPDVTAASVRVLNAEGFDVVVPPRQPCCGALALHEGRHSLAGRLGRRLVDTTSLEGIDAVIVNAAGCGSSMKRYGIIDGMDPNHDGRAAKFASKVRDLGEFLASVGQRADYRPLPMRLAFHDACHLAHAQGVRAEPRRALSAIPELQLLEVAEPELCCGSAGLYNLVEPEPANELGRRKAGAMLEMFPDAIVTSNPGCALQLARHLGDLKASGGPPPAVLQLAQVLDRSLNG